MPRRQLAPRDAGVTSPDPDLITVGTAPTRIFLGRRKRVLAPRVAGIGLLELIRDVGQLVLQGLLDVAGAQDLQQARAGEGGVAVRAAGEDAGVLVAGVHA